MGQQLDTQPTFFRRLAKDATANVIVISAASMVPLMAMVGGGVDASRYYMAETRLQAACDAGALAARRAMPAKVLDSASKTVGDNFFAENYPDGTFGLENLTHTYTADSEGEVKGVASGTLPSSIMGAFGYDEFGISVACSADVNISNTDIVFVLDVTGSMNCTAAGGAAFNTLRADLEEDGSLSSSDWDQLALVPNCSYGNNGEVEATDSKIDNLRASAETFYDTVDTATSDKATIRYGFVPYSHLINVGDSLNTSWMAQSHSYQSREPVWDIEWEEVSYTVSNTTTYGVEEFDFFQQTHYGNVSEYWCEYYMNQLLAGGDIDWRSKSTAGEVETGQTVNGNIRTTTGYIETTFERREKTYVFTPGAGPDQCHLGYNWYERDGEEDFTRVEEAEETFKEYRYYRRPFNLAGLYDDNQVTFNTGTSGLDENHTWTGCIEEANTVANSSFDPVPTGAYDLDIDLVPANDDERWKPVLNTLVHYRYDSSGNWTTSERTTTSDWSSPGLTCPKAARKLAELDSKSDLTDYLAEVPPSGSGETEGFKAAGATYHDIGMIWGSRFISPDGIFSSENATTTGGDSISRHIIFMTDGTAAASQTAYNVYGIEWWDRRVSGAGPDNTITDRIRANHAERFQAACRAARNKNISVWVVAFGTTLTQNLKDCATSGRAFSATDGTQLDAKFKEIAERIAELRLTD